MIPRLLELTTLFLKIGSLSFGGPAAHLAMMELEVVKRRRWLSRQEFLDLIGATHLIPGPNAVELAAHVGYCRAGLAGSLAAGLAFTLPAVLITAVFAYCYKHHGIKDATFLYGIQPAILAVIFAAVWRLGRKALRRWQLVLVGLLVTGAVVVFDRVEIPALFAGAALGVLLLTFSKVPDSPRPDDTDNGADDEADGDDGNDRQGVPPKEGGGKKLGAIAGLSALASSSTAKAATGAVTGVAVAAAAGVSLWKLGLFFAMVGAVMFGGGYVLIAYLEGGLVGVYDGFGEKELFDAIAIGQLTPGPLLTTATFAGYLIAGWPGAIVATVGILTPSFFLVTATNPLIPRMRKSRWMGRFLDAVNAASIGLMAAVTLKLSYRLLWNAQQWQLDWRSLLVAIVAGFLAVRYKLTPVWLVLGGAVAGWWFW